MGTANDLLDSAERLRRQLSKRRTAIPPMENGRRIGTVSDRAMRRCASTGRSSRESLMSCSDSGSAATMTSGGET